MTSMSLARFSLKYTTYFPMGIYVYGSIYSRSSTLARRDYSHMRLYKTQYEWSIDRERTRLLS